MCATEQPLPWTCSSVPVYASALGLRNTNTEPELPTPDPEPTTLQVQLFQEDAVNRARELAGYIGGGTGCYSHSQVEGLRVEGLGFRDIGGGLGFEG